MKDRICSEVKLRVIQVVNVRWFNATAWYALELSRLLKESGHTTLVLTLKDTETYHQAVKMGLSPVCLPLNTLNPIAFFKLIHDIKECINSFNPHIVNCHRGESFFIWGLLRSFGNYALVRTRGDQRKPKSTVFNKFLHKYMTDGIITTNSSMAKCFFSTMDISIGRIHTILGGVNTQKFYFSEDARKRVRIQYGFNAEHCVIGLLGRFDIVKGQREFIYAIASLIEEGYKNIRVLLIGFTTDVTQDEIETWVNDAGIKKYVVITGKIQDIQAHISALDIGVVASLWSEAIARAALEIMACKRPLISTCVGVMPDLLPKEALFKPNDKHAFVEILRKVISDTDWRTWLMETCYNKAKELTDIDFLKKILEAYQKSIDRRLQYKK